MWTLSTFFRPTPDGSRQVVYAHEHSARCEQATLKSRRVWVGTTDPSSPHCVLDPDGLVVLKVPVVGLHTFHPVYDTSWLHCSDSYSRRYGINKSWQAFGGAPAFFPDASAVWHQFQITLSEARDMTCRTGFAMTCRSTERHANTLRNSHSALNLAYLVVVSQFLHFWRSQIFPNFFQACRISLGISVSLQTRWVDPSSHYLLSSLPEIFVKSTLASSLVQIAQTGRKRPKHFGIELEKTCCCSPLIGVSKSIFVLGEFVVRLPAGRFSILFLVPFATPAFWVCSSWLCWGTCLICTVSIYN